jgi:hypothetical protein
MSCTARHDLSLFDTEVHIFGYDCTAVWVFPVLIIFTVLLKIYQNKVWGQLGQAQRVALQYSKRERAPYVWDIVRKEALSTTLGLVSIILVLGFNVWVMIAIVVGNLWGVYRTYSKLTKDSHSTAHDLVEMLEKHRSCPNPNTAKFLSLMNEMIGQSPCKEQMPEWMPKSDMVF